MLGKIIKKHVGDSHVVTIYESPRVMENDYGRSRFYLVKDYGDYVNMYLCDEEGNVFSPNYVPDFECCFSSVRDCIEGFEVVYLRGYVDE